MGYSQNDGPLLVMNYVAATPLSFVNSYLLGVFEQF